MEAADIVLVNKADGELMPQARHTKADYAGSIRYMRTKPSILHSHWKREVVLVSAKTGFGCEEFYNLLLKYYDTMNSTKTVLSFQDSEGGSSARSVTTAVTDVDVVTDTNVSVNCTSGKRHPHVHVTPQQHQHQHQQGNETHATEELNAKGSKEHVTSVFKYKRALQSNYWMWQQFTRQLVTILTHNYKHGHTYGEDDSSETSARSAGNITPDSSPVHNVLSSSSSNSKTNLSKRVSTLAKELEQRIYRDEISSRAAGGLLLKAALDGH